MRRFGTALSLATVLASFPARAEVVVSSKPGIVDASKAQTGLNFDAQVFERLPTSRDPRQLLALVPGLVDARPVDGVKIDLGEASAAGAQPFFVPPGWSWKASGKALQLNGPAVSGSGGIKFGFGLPKANRPMPFIDLQLFGGEQKLKSVRVPVIQLNPGKPVADPKAAIRIPQRLTPGDRIQFRPLDSKFTPGGGDWKIGPWTPRWNGSFDRPLYEFDVPKDLKGLSLPLKISFVSPWNEKLVDGIADDVAISPSPSAPSDRKEVTGCSGAVLDGGPLCVCGNFPPESTSELLINGKPIGEYLVASSPTILDLYLPSGFPAGSFDLGAGASSGFEIVDGARGVLIRVGGQIDKESLRRGQSTTLKLWLDGTEQPIDLRLWNSTPEIVTVAGGNDQVVKTSGGNPNQVTRTVSAVSPGDFALHYQLTVDQCPCAKQGQESGQDEVYDDPYEDFGPPQPGPEPPEGGPIDGATFNDWQDRLRFWREEGNGIDCRNEVIDRLIAELWREIGELEDYLEDASREVAEALEGHHDHQQHVDQEERLDGLQAELEALQKLAHDLDRLPNCDPRRGKEPDKTGSGGGHDVIPPRIDLTLDLPKDASDDCRRELKECDELLRKADALVREASHLRDIANQLSGPIEAFDADEKQVDVLRRQAGDTRALERSALERAATSAARNREQPDKGYDRDETSARKDAAGYAADAERLEQQAHGLELKIAERSTQVDVRRKFADEAKRAAEAAERAAAKALREYLDCLLEMNTRCPLVEKGGGASGGKETKEPHGGGGTKEEKPEAPKGSEPVGGTAAGGSPSGGAPFDEEAGSVGMCGADLTAIFEASLVRTAQRVAGLPVSEVGFKGGAGFLERNWPTYSWKKPMGESGESGEWDWSWDEVLDWRDDPGGSCPVGRYCSNTNMLWGKCLSASFIADIYEDFLEELVSPPRLGLEGGPQGAGKKARCEAVAHELVEALGHRIVAPPLGNSSELHERARKAFEKAWTEVRSTSGLFGTVAICAPCSEVLHSFLWDFSRADWYLPGGKVQHEDGSVTTRPTPAD